MASYVAVANKKSADQGYAVWKGAGIEDVDGGNVEALVSQVIQRKNLIDYVMFDPSHGTNLNLDLNEDSLTIKFGQSIYENPKLNHLGLVYAGGINSENVGPITKTLNSFFPKRISVDTESRVRTNDELDLMLVENYLIKFKNISF